MAAPATMPTVPVPDHPPLAIWHSPLLRAAQTAQAIHAARGGDAPLQPLEELQELGQGEWEGRTHAEVRARWPDELAAWRRDPLVNHAPGGESLPDAMVRTAAAREVILRDRGNDAGSTPWAIVVAHDGILRLLLLGLLGIAIEHFWSFPMTLASVSVIDLSGDVAQLRAHNLDAHVTDLGHSAERPAGML